MGEIRVEDVFVPDVPKIYEPDMGKLVDVLKSYYALVKDGRADASVPHQILGQVISSLASAVDFWQQQPSAKGKLLLIIDAGFPFGYKDGLSVTKDFYQIFQDHGFWPIVARTMDVAKILLKLQPSAVIFEMVDLRASWFGPPVDRETMLNFVKETRDGHPMLLVSCGMLSVKDEDIVENFGQDNIFLKFDTDIGDVIARLKEIVGGE